MSEQATPVKEPPAPSEESQPINIKYILGRVTYVLVAVGITLLIASLTPHIQRFTQYGYTGVFLISLIANASIMLPIPSLAVTFMMGNALSWPLVGLLAGIGEALGESTGYLAGYGGSMVIENKDMYTRLQYWMENHGMLTIFILSVIPNPLIDLAGISAGALKYSYWKFLSACWAGKTIKTLLFAWAGSQSLGLFIWFLENFG